MNVAVRNSYLPSVHHQGLNGFWGSVGRIAKRFAAKALRQVVLQLKARTFGISDLLGLSDLISGWADALDASANASSSKDISESQLTATEISILTNFSEKKLAPFAEKAFTSFFNALNTGTVQEQLAAANYVLKLKGALIRYYGYHETTGLSAVAIEYRLQIIEALFLNIEDTIEFTFDENFSRLTTTDNMVQSSDIPNFSNLIPSSVVGMTFSAERLQPVVPVDQLPTQTVIVPTSETTTAELPQVLTPQTPAAVNSPGKGKKLLIGVLAAVALWSFWPSNKSKN